MKKMVHRAAVQLAALPPS
uniref:Uncharacterized protein n=1 Tax=Arundo donax TaxID=35708 RepID=A0A0A9FNI8_ARUDO